MARFSRRRFLQLFAAGTTQGQSLLKSGVAGIVSGFLAACGSIRRTLRKPHRWIFPSALGDFVIESPDDLQKISSFPAMVFAYRAEFPAVAATVFEPEVDPRNDADQVVVRDVWVVIDAKRGTRLFREYDIVRSGETRAAPAGDFTLALDPIALFREFEVDAPVAPAFERSKRRFWTEKLERAKLLEFQFCVDPDRCPPATGRTTLPLVTARWPAFDILVRTTTCPVRLRRVTPLQTKDEPLVGCRLKGFGEVPPLRWASAIYEAPKNFEQLLIPVRHGADGALTSVVVPASLQIRIRPAVIDLVIPESSHLTSGNLASPLSTSHLLTGNHFAYAWLSDMPVEATPLTPEIAWDFCLVPDRTSKAPWALVPQPIRVARLGTAMHVNVDPADVHAARVSYRRRKGSLVNSVEEQLHRVAIQFRSRSALRPELTFTADTDRVIDLSIVDGAGILRTERATVSSTGSLLVDDLFVKPSGAAEILDIRFMEKNDGTWTEPPSKIVMHSSEAAWAGRLMASGSGESNWAHLNPVQRTPGPGNARFLTPYPEVTIDWKLHEGGFQLSTPTPTAPAGEIVSLAPEAFRAAVPDAFPHRERHPLLLPSFALREHEHLDANFATWISPNKAFTERTMWEPRSEARFSVASDSPSDLFSAFAARHAASDMRAYYAGFHMTGDLLPLAAAKWAPDDGSQDDATPIEGLAPYRSIQGRRIWPLNDAVDVVDLCKTRLRLEVREAFDKSDPRSESLQKAFVDENVELAYSPVGGTIAYDWVTPFSLVGLTALTLRGLLGRYQKNYAIFQDLLLPWGIRITVLTLTARQDSGKLRYCTKWWFAEESKAYGERDNIVIHNLRPINAVNFDGAAPLKFKADLTYATSDGTWTDHDRELQGAGMITNAPPIPGCGSNPIADLDKVRASQTVALRKPQPLSLFGDTPLRLAKTEWRSRLTADAPLSCAPANTPAVEPPVEIDVIASGELEDVKGMNFDSRRVDVTCLGRMGPDSGVWCSRRDQDPVYFAKALTLGDGVVRMKKPLVKDRWHVQAGLKHSLAKTIKLKDVALLQMIAGGDSKEFLENEGTLTITQKMRVAAGSDVEGVDAQASVEAVMEFAQFTRGVQEICGQAMNFRIAAAPRSFRASFLQEFGQEASYNVRLVSDLGIPGFIRLKDCEITSRPGTAIEFKPGDLDICGELLKKVLDALIEFAKKKAGFGDGDGGDDEASPFSFEFLDKLTSFLVKLRLPLPSLPLGIGTIQNFGFDLRFGVSLDFSGSGFNAGALMTFIVGDFRFPGFGGVDWNLPGIRFVDVVRRIFQKVDRPTVIATPWVFRFGIIFAARIRPPKLPDGLAGGFDVVCFDTAICVRAEAGLGLTFDVGVARGAITVTIGIIWCPNATFTFELQGDPKANAVFSFDEITLVARIDAYATVLGLVNVSVFVEIMADLRLACREGIVSHMEVSGTAHIEIGFVEFDKDFEVDLDPILGIDPNACQLDKGDPANLCIARSQQWEREMIRSAGRELFGSKEVAA